MKAKRILASVLSVALLLQLSPLNIWALDENPQQTPQVSTVQENLDPVTTAEPIPEETSAPTPEPTAEPTAAPAAAEPTAAPAAEESAPDAAAAPTPEPSAEPTAAPDPAAEVQAMIDALPDEVTEDNAAAVEQALTDIDDAKESLTDEQLAGLDFARYDAAANALLALWGEAPADAVELLDDYPTPNKDDKDYYLIYDESNLRWFAQQVNGGNKAIKAKLMNDITMDGTEWTPIGTEARPFEGIFDGNGKTITGLTCTDKSKDYVGLVGFADGATIQGVTVKDSKFNGKEYIGAVCGFIVRGRITGCTNNGSTVNGWANSGSSGQPGWNVGGIAGRAKYATIQRCVNTGNVTGINDIGGIVGSTEVATVQDCGNTGEVTGIGKYYGGIAGAVAGSSNQIHNCYNAHSSTADKIYGNGSCSHSNCYYLANDTGSSGSTDKEITAKTQAQFASGEVAFLLQSKCAEATWGQTLTVDKYPVLGGTPVYQTTPCTAGYSNTPNATFDHEYDENGVCIHCCGWQPAEWKSDCYEISNQGQLRWFADQVNHSEPSINARLAKNITMDSTAWTPIGTSYTLPFQGTFNGNNFTISGLKCADTSADYVGLFGCVGEGGIVKNVNVTDSYMSGSFYVGGICGCNKGGAVENCTSGCTVTGTGDCIGGICGSNEEKGSVLNCHNTGKVTGTRDYTGGVCGFNKGILQESYNIGEVSGYKYVGGVCGQSYGTVNGCYNTGEVLGEGNVGGVCGSNESSGTVNRCYNTGKVSGYNYVGGVCGYNDFSGTVNGCYNTGEVDGNEFVGGVCGWNGDYGTVQNSYNIGTVSGDNNVGNVGGVCGGGSNSTDCYYLSDTSGTDSNGGIPKTEAEFQSGEVAFLLQSKCAEATWGQTLTVDKYPVLGGTPVYQTTPCTAGYSNQEGTHKDHADIDENGQCTACGTQCIAYTVTIPATVALGNEKTQTADITAKTSPCPPTIR